METVTTLETAKGKLVYTLFSTESDNTVYYGIKVTSKLFGDEEEASQEKISSDRSFAEEMLRLMADNLVLPSTFNEIAEEYITAAFTV